MRLPVFVSLFCLVSVIALAQDSTQQRTNDPLSFMPVVDYGRVWKHTKKFTSAIEGPSTAIELNFIKQTRGTKYWQHFYKLPQYGIALSAIRYGNDDVLGFGFGFMPFLQIPVITRHHFQVFFKMGTGVAYLTKRYDVISNPENDVIASHINDITSFALRARIDISNHSSVVFGSSFTHYSAGATRLPNLGINVPAFINVGYSYTFNPIQKPEDIQLKPETKQKQIILRNKIALARFQDLQSNGPFYSQYGIEMAAGRYMTQWNKLFVNAEFFYNTFIYYYLLNQEINKGHEAANSIGATVSVEDEFMFNRIGVNVALGYVLYQPYFSGYSYFEKVGVQYHFFYWGMNKKKNLFAGVILKTHWAQAEHVETALGVEW